MEKVVRTIKIWHKKNIGMTRLASLLVAIYIIHTVKCTNHTIMFTFKSTLFQLATHLNFTKENVRLRLLLNKNSKLIWINILKITSSQTSGQNTILSLLFRILKIKKLFMANGKFQALLLVQTLTSILNPTQSVTVQDAHNISIHQKKMPIQWTTQFLILEQMRMS